MWTHPHQQKGKEAWEAVESKIFYSLDELDVRHVLKEKDVKLSDKEIEDLFHFLYEKFHLPWDEYIGIFVDEFLERQSMD